MSKVKDDVANVGVGAAAKPRPRGVRCDDPRKKELVRVAKTVNSWSVADECKKEEVKDDRPILKVHFAMTGEMATYAASTYPGFRVVSVSPNSYDHGRSALDRIAVAHFLVNGLNDEIGNPSGSPIAELHGLKYRKLSNFDTKNTVHSFGGHKSQFASIEEMMSDGFPRPVYMIGFNMYDFKPTQNNWWQIGKELLKTVMRRGLFAYVPTEFALEAPENHEIAGTLEAAGTVLVRVANTHYRDTDNTWMKNPGRVLVAESGMGGGFPFREERFVIDWQTLPVKCGSFRVLEVWITEESKADVGLDVVSDENVVAIEQLINDGTNLSGKLIGVSVDVASEASVNNGIVTVKSDAQGFVQVKADFVGKIARKALLIRDLGNDAARMQLERFALSIGEASAAQITVAVALARIAAARLSLAGSLLTNDEDTQKLFDMARKARAAITMREKVDQMGWQWVPEMIRWLAVVLFGSAGILFNEPFLLFLAAVMYFLPVPGIYAFFGLSCVIFLLFVSIAASHYMKGDFAAKDGKYAFKPVNGDVRVVGSIKGEYPQLPEDPTPNAEYIFSNKETMRKSAAGVDFVSAKRVFCLYFGALCEKPIEGELRDGTTITQVRETKFESQSPSMAFVGIQVATAPHVYAVSTSNEEKVLRMRAFAKKGVVNQTSMFMFKTWVEANFLSIFNLQGNYTVVADDEAWFSQLEPKKAAIYAKHDAQRVDLTKGELQRDSFTKLEMVMKNHHEKVGRLVQGASASVNRLVGPWVSRFSAVLHILWHHNHRVFFNGSVDAETEGDRFEQLVEGGNRWADGDFSGFDSTQSAEMFEVLHYVYERFGAPPHVMKILRAQVSKLGYTRAGFRYTAVGTRASGDQDTLVGNGIVNTLTNLWAWCVANGRLEDPVMPFSKEELDEALYLYEPRSTRTVDLYEPDETLINLVLADVRDAVVKPSVTSLVDLMAQMGRGDGVERSMFYIEHCGDDNLLFYDPSKSLARQASLICELGMVNNIKSAEHPEICSSLFWPTIVNGRKAFVLSAKPGRLAVKLGFISKPVGKLMMHELASKIYGTLVDCHHVPFLSQLLIKYLELIPGDLAVKALYHKYKAHAREKYPVTDDGIVMFCERYGVSRAEYDDLVSGLDTIKSLPWDYRHPVFDRLYEVDNDMEF